MTLIGFWLLSKWLKKFLEVHKNHRNKFAILKIKTFIITKKHQKNKFNNSNHKDPYQIKLFFEKNIIHIYILIF